mgnify:CR=1 FL=1
MAIEIPTGPQPKNFKVQTVPDFIQECGASILGRKSQVHVVLESLERVTASLVRQVEQLEGRLLEVLRAEEQPENKKSEVRPTIVPFAEQLYFLNDRLEATSERLTAILNNLEL